MTKEKLHIPFPVIVEGKYDKIRLSNIMEGQIITTDGFFSQQSQISFTAFGIFFR